VASEKTNADALRLYLTGASSVGAAQPYHSHSLGGLRSSEELGLGHDLVNPISGIVVDFVSYQNGVGSGALTAISASSIAWTPPGSTQGAVITIANGETKVVEGSTLSQYVRVTRNSATDLGGTATVVTKRCWGSAIAGRDTTVAGLTSYTGLIFKNESGLEITSLVVWIAADTEARLWVAQEAVVSDAIQDISVEGDTSAPDGVTGWNQGTTSGAGLAIGTVAAGASVGLWLKRVVPGAVDATPRQIQSIAYQFTYSGVTYANGATGYYRVSDSTLANYLLYRGVNSEPDLSAAPYETFAGLGHVTAATAAGATYYFVLRLRNKYGLISQNIVATRIEIDALGVEVVPSPSAPEEPLLSAGLAGIVTASALYQPNLDGDNAADTWQIFLTSDGSTPDPAVDIPTEETMEFIGGLARLDWDSTAFTDGATIKVIIRTSQTGVADSTNSNVLTATASTTGAAAITLGACYGLNRAGETVVRVWTHDASNYIDLITETNVFRFVVGGAVVGGITSSGYFARAGVTDNTAYTFDIFQEDLIEIDSGSGALCFAGGAAGSRYRMMEISTAGDLQVSGVTVEGAYPFAEVNTDYITWATTNLDFSGDLANVLVRVTQLLSGGVQNGNLHTKGVVTI